MASECSLETLRKYTNVTLIPPRDPPYLCTSPLSSVQHMNNQTPDKSMAAEQDNR